MTINRRQFMMALSAAGAGAALSLHLLEREQALTPRPLAMALARGATGFIREFTVYGAEERSRAGNFGLRRAGGQVPLYQFALNPYGGMLTFVARPGDEIAVNEDHPVNIDHDFDGACHLVTHVMHDDGRHSFRHDHFILRRPLPGSDDQLLIHRETLLLGKEYP
jgi:hypothetical protein